MGIDEPEVDEGKGVLGLGVVGGEGGQDVCSSGVKMHVCWQGPQGSEVRRDLRETREKKFGVTVSNTSISRSVRQTAYKE